MPHHLRHHTARMNTMTYKNISLAVAILAAVLCNASYALAQGNANIRPSLVITNDPVPEALKRQIYSKPVRTKDIRSEDVVGRGYFSPQQTVVTDKISELRNELAGLQNDITAYSSTLNTIQRENEARSADYFSAVATINTQLQSGTTPGNPRLSSRLTQAESSLETLAASISNLSELASSLANAGAKAGFLLESTRAAYGISGAVEEDHVMLAEMEDSIHNTTVILERVLNSVNDDITRTSSYISSERNNMRTLSLAVANGDLYGKSLSDRPFSNASPFMAVSQTSPAGAAPDLAGNDFAQGPATATPAVAGSLAAPRPLVKIRFDRPDVDYEQPVYLAVNEALQRYPNARFDLVAVHPSTGNAAEVAIESTRARRNAENVLRTLTQMGLPLERIDLSYDESMEAKSNEVHLYIR